MATLDEFLRHQVAVRRWTYAELARRSGLPRSTVHKLATTRLRRAPEPHTLERLAIGLGLPFEQLQALAAESLGFTLTHESRTDPEISLITASLERLSPEDRQHVLALVSSLLAQERNRPRSA